MVKSKLSRSQRELAYLIISSWLIISKLSWEQQAEQRRKGHRVSTKKESKAGVWWVSVQGPWADGCTTSQVCKETTSGSVRRPVSGRFNPSIIHQSGTECLVCARCYNWWNECGSFFPWAFEGLAGKTDIDKDHDKIINAKRRAMGASGVQASGRQKTSLRLQWPISFKGRQGFPWWTAFLCVNGGSVDPHPVQRGREEGHAGEWQECLSDMDLSVLLRL